MMCQSYAKVIVNPVAGAGSTEKKWPAIRGLLNEAGLVFDFEHTERIGHAEELAREAANSGYGLIVAVGGDGTLNEVVNGLADSDDTDNISLGMLSTGSGSDFVRSLDVPLDYRWACQRLVNPRKTKIDVGIVEYRSGGKTARRYFLNAAGVGFDGEVVATVERSRKLCRGTLPYVIGLFRALVTYQNKDITLQVDTQSKNVRICSVVVANGRYFGGGMHVAPGADLKDGLLEVVVVSDIGKFELLRAFPKIYRGTHVMHPKVQMAKATAITIRSSEQVLIQADGELLGEVPATFRIQPAALSVAM